MKIVVVKSAVAREMYRAEQILLIAKIFAHSIRHWSARAAKLSALRKIRNDGQNQPTALWCHALGGLLVLVAYFGIHGGVVIVRHAGLHSTSSADVVQNYASLSLIVRLAGGTMKYLSAAFFVMVGSLAGLLLCFTLYSSFKRCAFGDFERGANAVMLHHKYFGDYGSFAYRERVFESGKDPQDSIDVEQYRQPKEK